MASIVITNIAIIKDAFDYGDGLVHYIATFDLAGLTPDSYKVEYNAGSGYFEIDATITGTTAKYMLGATDVSHTLRITVYYTYPTTESTLLPSYDEGLPDYATSIQNRFDYYDGTHKIAVFKPARNKWTGAYKWQPDCMDYLGNKLLGFKDGMLYLHNEDFTSFNIIYGEEYPQRICVPINIGDPSAVKDVMDIALEVNGKVPNYTVLYSSYPIEQITDIAFDDVRADNLPAWENKDGILYASFLRDRLSDLEGGITRSLLEGDIITSISPKVMIEFVTFDSQLNINFLNLGVLLSSGNSSILNK